VEALIQSADIAMYHVKGRGKNGYQFFSDEMNNKFSTRLSLERELRSALATGQLRVYYQPQVDLADGRIIGVEALVRWQHPRRGLIEPDDFLSVAEETGLIIQLDEWVQMHAFTEVASGAGPVTVTCAAIVGRQTSQQLEQDGFSNASSQISMPRDCPQIGSRSKLPKTRSCRT
jgi:predicted signal transduction protein with EAL and GGDEF domain